MNKYLFRMAIAAIFFFSCKTSQKIQQAPEEISNTENRSTDLSYRAAYTRYFDLIHTRLDVAPDWENKILNGTARIEIKPHFYPSDSLVLNARGMLIHDVKLEVNDNDDGVELPFKWKADKMTIHLDRKYTRDDTLNIRISYTARPETLPEGGSAAIQKDKGLYFINADGKDPYKPRELWTQGETESNSVWFPTIEDPGQRMTQEIYLTVDSSLRTLSNGLLLSSVTNPDGTRTDYWKESLSMPPYLSMIAVGDFAIVKDNWKDREVSYYTDKNYEKYARMVFGNTPEMMDFFSYKLGVLFLWEKYSQIIVHDYVSGAMENATAVVHGTNMLQDEREYRDYNYEDIIAHELFHHWFGDLVTCASWSNVTLNEGFATYGEYLWMEYKYGRDSADYLSQQDLKTYLHRTKKTDAPLIRYHYSDKEDMYDAISYQKGGRVLHMLRKLIGDEAFFRSLKNYLIKYQFDDAEIHQLRIEFEKVCGQDLNWFFNQWYFRPGKPSLDIATTYDNNTKELKISLQQTQDLKKNSIYRLPMEVDIYSEKSVIRKSIVMDSLKQDFVFSIDENPELVNVDAEKSLLLEKKTEHKSREEWIYQYHHAPLYLDRYEAVEAIGKEYRVHSPGAELIKEALGDKFWNIRVKAIENVKELAMNSPSEVRDMLINLAKNDSIPIVRAAAIEAIGKYFPYEEMAAVLLGSIPDFSYYVEATAFSVISSKDKTKALELAPMLEKDSGSVVSAELCSFYAGHPELDKMNYFIKSMHSTGSWSQYSIINDFGTWLKPQNISSLRKGSEEIFLAGTRTNNRHIKNNCAATLIRIQNEIDSRLKADSGTRDRDAKNNTPSYSISVSQVDRIQLEQLKADNEEKIKTLESGKESKQ